MPLTLRLFGPFELAPTGEPCSRKSQWLLALLALRHGREVERSWLAGTLWPDASETQARYDLRRELSRLRRALGPEAYRLQGGAGTLCLDLVGADVDLIAFDEAARIGDETALDRYRGPLLADCAEVWVHDEREARRRAFLELVNRFAAQARARSEPAAAAAFLRRAVAADPLDEGLRRALMSALAAAGSHAAALAAYRDLRLSLERDLQIDPAPETRALYNELTVAARRPVPRPAAERPIRGSIPRPLGRVVGREADAAAVAGRLRDDRLVTLTGAGGVGKSRLAVEVAAALATAFADGVAFVQLGRLSDPELVAPAIAQALGVRESAETPIDELLAAAVTDRELLVVLDDCDRVLPACARLVETLLHASAHVKVLATSRQSLGLPAEVAWLVPSLAVADAIALFGQLAGRAVETEVAEQICRRVDGIPLAIELAAARTRALSPRQIAERLDDRFRLLTAGNRAGLRRHRTLEAALDWSYELLDAEEKTLLGELSVFAGGFALEAAEAVHGADALDLLDRLVDRSLVVFDGRYHLLESVRAYAQMRGVSDDARDRHLEHFVALAEEADSHIFAGSRDEAWVERLHVESDNLRAAFEWAFADEARAGGALRLLAAVYWFWFDDGRVREARSIAAAALRLRGHAQRPAHAAMALAAAGWVAVWARDYPSMRAHFAEGLAIARADGAPKIVASVLCGHATSCLVDGDAVGARVALEEAEVLCRALGDQALLAVVVQFLGGVHLALGDLDTAEARLAEALEICRARDYRAAIGYALVAFGQIAQARGDHRAACAHYLEGLRTFHPREHCGRFQALAALGRLALLEGHLRPAARLLGAADALHRRIGVTLFLPERPQLPQAHGELSLDWDEGRREEANLEALVAAWSRPVQSQTGNAGGPTEKTDIAAGTRRNVYVAKFT